MTINIFLFLVFSLLFFNLYPELTKFVTLIAIFFVSTVQFFGNISIIKFLHLCLFLQKKGFFGKKRMFFTLLALLSAHKN